MNSNTGHDDTPAQAILREDMAREELKQLREINAALVAERDRLRNALRSVLRYCVTVTGCPERSKGRTPEQQAALDSALAALAEGGK